MGAGLGLGLMLSRNKSRSGASLRQGIGPEGFVEDVSSGNVRSVDEGEEEEREREMERRRRHIEVSRAETILIEDHGGTPGMSLEKLALESSEEAMGDGVECDCGREAHEHGRSERLEDEDEGFAKEVGPGDVRTEADWNDVDVETGRARAGSGSGPSSSRMDEDDRQANKAPGVHEAIVEVELYGGPPHSSHSPRSPHWPHSPYPPESPGPSSSQSLEFPSSPSALIAKPSGSQERTRTRSSNGSRPEAEIEEQSRTGRSRGRSKGRGTGKGVVWEPLDV